MGLGRELYSFDAKQKISSIDVENNQESNELFPNPTNGTIYSKSFEDLSSVYIYSSTGQKSKVIVVDGILDISEYSSGLYYILIESKNKLIRYKVLKI